MRLVNLTPHLKVRRNFEAWNGAINGCSGYFHRFSATDVQENDFCRADNLSVWDLLTGPTPLYNVGQYTNRRLSVVFPPKGHRIPKPSRFYKPPAGYKAWYLRRDGKIAAILGTRGPAMFSDPQSQPLWAISDPEKYLSMKHMQDCGYLYIPPPKGEQDPGDALCTGRWNSEGQLIFDCPYARLGGANTNPLNAWSQEWPWMTKLPWWEMHRAAQVPYCTSEDLRRVAFNTFFENVKRAERFNGTGWISGCMRLDGPTDSCRAVFSLYDLDREKSGDPAAEQYVEYNGKKMYYKVLPFYFHSPQHQNHRVTAAFVSAKPLTIEPVVV